MNLFPALLWTSLLLAQAPAPAEVRIEPCYQIEIERNYTFRGEPQKEREVFYTAAELPWIDQDYNLITRLETGFKRSEEAATVELDGKSLPGKKISYVRDKSQVTNVAAAAIHFWVSPSLKTPAFGVRLERKVNFLVPEGCVKLQVVPHPENAAGVEASEVTDSVTASGEYKKGMKYKIGEKELDAHEFVIEITEPFKQSNTYVISKEVPGGICSRVWKAMSSGSIAVKALTLVPEGQNRTLFAKEGFSFAPPEGFQKVNPKAGEVARYTKGADIIAIAVFDLGKGGLEELIGEILKDEKNRYNLRYIGTNLKDHLAGHSSFRALNQSTYLSSIVAQHGRRAYVLSSNLLNGERKDEAKALLKGWRWIVPPTEK